MLLSLSLSPVIARVTTLAADARLGRMLGVEAWNPLLLAAFDFSNKQAQIYNILFVLVFGFATLNILSLVARRFEPERGRNRLTFGESIAVTVVLVSIGLLGWEMLTIFKVFPIKLHPR